MLRLQKRSLPWLISPLLVWVLLGLLDQFILSTRPPLLSYRAPIFALDQLMRLVFWLIWAVLILVLPRVARVGAAVWAALLTTVLAMSSWILYQEFDEYLSLTMVKQVLDNPHDLLYYFQSYLSGGVAIVSGLFLVGAFFLWLPVVRAPRASPLKGMFAVVGLGIFYLFLLNALHIRTHGVRTSFESSAMVSLKRYIAVRDQRVLYLSPNRLMPESYRPRETPNILVFLNESWGKASLTAEENGQAGMPFLREWMHREPSEMISFEQGFSNSSDTKVSVPSIMTGLSPERSLEDLHRVPFFWHWLKAGGYSSLFVTSQTYNWCGFWDFFFTGFPGKTLSAENMGAPTVNDLGVDDMISSHRFNELLAKRPKNQPFFAVYGTNALHAPGQEGSPLIPELPSQYPRYMKALRVLDGAIHQVYDELKREGLLENTIILFTGDHGTIFLRNASQVPRIYTYRDSVVNIPMILRLPKRWITQNPRAYRQLLTNRKKNVANVDWLPTLAEMMGASAGSPQNRNLLTGLSGVSWLHPVPDDRIINSLYPIRRVNGDSRGALVVIQGSIRLVISTIEGKAIYDIAEDPAETKNLWNDPAISEVKERLLAHVQANPEMAHILRATVDTPR